MIYIYGASGQGKVIAEILTAAKVDFDAFIDDKPLLGFFNKTVASPSIITQDDNLLIAIGDNKTRKLISEKWKGNKFLIAQHPSAIISPSATVHEGTVMMANVTINASSYIGKHVIVNTNASIDHDCEISDYVHICPNVALAGNVSVGEGTQVGIGSCVIQGVKIGKWAVIGAGTVIIEDVPDGAVVVGNPGRIVKYINQ